MSYGSHGGGRDVSYQLNRLTDVLEDMNRKLSRALRDLDLINHRLDTMTAQEEFREQGRDLGNKRAG